MRFTTLIAAAILAISSEAGAAQHPPCDPTGDDAAKATRLLHSIDNEVATMASDDDATRIATRISTLLESPCYGRFRSEVPALPRTAPELRWWWNEAEASQWFAFYLVDLDATWGKSDKRRIATAPTVRRELSLETADGTEYAEVLCSRDDTTCGLETRGWILRAEKEFDDYSQSAGFSDPPFLDDEVRPVDARCATMILSPDGVGGRYRSWRECIENKLGLVDAFPVGRFRAPTSGWILFEGRRGHYEFCDQLSIFDISTGSAIVAKSCSGLVLQPGGSVDFDATASMRETTVQFGRVSVDNLRELALITVILPAMQRDVRPFWNTFEVPTSVPDDQLTLDEYTWIQHMVTTGTTALRWTWLRDGREPVRRSIDWGGWTGGATDHATSLLEVVEASFVPGCVARPLPAAIFDGLPTVNRVDADPEELDDVFLTLRRRAASELANRCCPD